MRFEGRRLNGDQEGAGDGLVERRERGTASRGKCCEVTIGHEARRVGPMGKRVRAQIVREAKERRTDARSDLRELITGGGHIGR